MMGNFDLMMRLMMSGILKSARMKNWMGRSGTVCIIIEKYGAKYDEGDPLLKMRKEDSVIITVWVLIEPLLIENQKTG